MKEIILTLAQISALVTCVVFILFLTPLMQADYSSFPYGNDELFDYSTIFTFFFLGCLIFMVFSGTCPNSPIHFLPSILIIVIGFRYVAFNDFLSYMNEGSGKLRLSQVISLSLFFLALALRLISEFQWIIAKLKGGLS